MLCSRRVRCLVCNAGEEGIHAGAVEIREGFRVSAGVRAAYDIAGDIVRDGGGQPRTIRIAPAADLAAIAALRADCDVLKNSRRVDGNSFIIEVFRMSHERSVTAINLFARDEVAKVNTGGRIVVSGEVVCMCKPDQSTL